MKNDGRTGFRGPGSEVLPRGCREAVELLPLVASGVASEFEAEQVSHHAAGCSSCRARLADVSLLAAALREDAGSLVCQPPGAAASAAARVAERLADHAEARSFRLSRDRAALKVAPVAATSALALVTLAAGTPGRPAWVPFAAGVYLAASLVVVPVLLLSRLLVSKEE